MFRETPNRVFVSCASTNIDRIVTLFRACKQANRILVLDLFSMMVLMRLKKYGKIPQPDWQGNHMLAVVTQRMTNLVKRLDEDNLVDDFHKKGIVPTHDDTWIWSIWNVYLKQDATKPVREFFAPCHKEYVHTSGHASLELLKQFSQAMQPNLLIPVHRDNWLNWVQHFPNAIKATDGEWLELALSEQGVLPYLINRRNNMIDSINEKFEKLRGKSRGYPGILRYILKKITDNHFELCIEDAKEDDNVWKLADPWGFAAFDEVKKKLKPHISLRFAMRKPADKDRPSYEALKRCLSYLALANNISITLTAGEKEERLYTLTELKDRKGEVVRESFKDRSDADTPGRLEKDFQAYLFGKGLYENGAEDGRTNERLALFGPDFSDIKKQGFLVEREFPTGAFAKEVKENNRILPTGLIDLVTINKNKEIAIIELKFDGQPLLDVISQLLDYALYFYSYKAQLAPLLDERLQCDSRNLGIKAYLVSNTFHWRFKDVWPFYSHGPIAMRQVIMGYMPEK